MRWIYISPHLDDAALSCGGLIWEQAQTGIPVEIWTVTCGVPEQLEYSLFAQVQHFMWGVENAAQAMSMRRAEDIVAAGILGAKPVHFEMLDCIYRRSPEGGWLYNDISVPLHPADAGLPDEIARTLATHLEPEDVVVCPLTVGDHVDHVLVRAAIEKLDRPLLYYADIPYLFTRWRGLLAYVDGKCAKNYPVSEPGLEAWQQGIDAYASQLSSMFETEDERRQAIKAYRDGTFGLTLWQSALG